MKITKIVFQVLGILLLIPVVALATLWYDNRNADGPSILFPGGELVSGDLYTGPEPDWSFTENVPTIELQLDDSLSSRYTWILENEGKIYVVSGYMNSTLGRLWKHWAVQADKGDGLAVIRINGIRYERQLVRIKTEAVLDGVAKALAVKYSGQSPVTEQDIAMVRNNFEVGEGWVFELAPRGR